MTVHRSDSDETGSRLDPTSLVRLTALVSFAGFLRLSERYLPAYLEAIGFGPVVVGLLGSLALALAVGGRFVDVGSLVTSLSVGTTAARAGADADGGQGSSGDEDDRRRSALAAITTASAAGGLLVWAGAPTLDVSFGTPFTAAGWLLLGVVLCGPWHAWGPGANLSIGDHGLSLGAGYGLGGSTVRDRVRARTGGGRIRAVAGSPHVASALGVAGAAVVGAVGFTVADAVPVGFELVAVVGAAAGVAAGVVLAVTGGEPLEPTGRSTLEGAGSNVAFDAAGPNAGFAAGSNAARGDAESNATSIPALDRARSTYESLPDERRGRLIGDALVRLGVTLASLYIVVLVVDVRAVALSAGPISLAPIAAFGAFVFVEAMGAIAGASVAPALEAAHGNAVLLGGLAILASLPVAFLLVPASPLPFVAVFALLGARTALEPLRPLSISGSRSDRTVPGDLLPVVHAALVPAPLLGGLLYAVDPALAFTAATTIGLLGVGEAIRLGGWR